MLYLHIGHMKTGTTSLQNLLASKRGELAKSGIEYPQGGSRLGYQHGEMLARAARQGQFDELEETLQHHRDTPILILSGETLSNVPVGAGRQLCKWLSKRRRLRVIYTIRDWTSYFPSRYQQNIKMGDGWNFEEFIQESERTFADHPDHNFSLNLNEYVDPTFGLTVFEYDRSVCSRILAYMGIDATIIPSLKKWDNQSGEFKNVESARLLNHMANSVLGRRQNLKFLGLLERRPPPSSHEFNQIVGFMKRNVSTSLMTSFCERHRIDYNSASVFQDKPWSSMIRSIQARSDIDFHPAPEPLFERFSFSYTRVEPADDQEVHAHLCATLAEFVAQLPDNFPREVNEALIFHIKQTCS